MKAKHLTVTYWENKWLGDEVESHPYLSTVIVWISAILGALYIGGNALNDMFDWNVDMSLRTALLTLATLLTIEIAESIMVTSNAATAVKRLLMVIGMMIIMIVVGGLTSIVAIIVAVLVALILIGSIILKMLFSSSTSSGSSASNGSQQDDEYEYKTTNENGFERKLKDVGFGHYEDDEGGRWKDSGYNTVERDD